MKWFVTLLLAGATIVAAQRVPTQAQEMEQLAIQLQERLAAALNQANENVDLAQKAAMEFHRQMKGKSAEEVANLMEQRRIQTQAQLDIAILALERASEKVGVQVEEVRVQIQTRLAAKKEELMQLQERIRAKEGSDE
ncbi:MAG: hypothetical protein JW913_07415 [Chitinispirillaceae bacterium]|nr:hypothetical protein [Chitinispirillaceae bacterium]